jgi:flavin-dependent dehydrogenase
MKRSWFMLTGDAANDVARAYDAGFADGVEAERNKPRWEGTFYYIGEEKVGHAWVFPYGGNVVRGTLLNSVYGRPVSAAFKSMLEAKAWVEKHARRKEEK